MPIEERTHSPQMQLRGHPARPQTCAGFWKYTVSRIFWHSFHFLCMSAKSHGPVSVARLSMLRVRILLPAMPVQKWTLSFTRANYCMIEKESIVLRTANHSLHPCRKKPACFQVIQENVFESAQPLETLRRIVHLWVNTMIQICFQDCNLHPKGHIFHLFKGTRNGWSFWLLSNLSEL